MEFKEQGRCFLVVELGIVIHCTDLQRIKKLDPCDRNTRLNGQDDGVNRIFHSREGTDSGRHRLWDTIKLQADFGDDPQRPFGTDKQTGEVITGR